MAGRRIAAHVRDDWKRKRKRQRGSQASWQRTSPGTRAAVAGRRPGPPLSRQHWTSSGSPGRCGTRRSCFLASEAMANAARHAGASQCAVRLACSGGLVVEVEGDGGGIPAATRRGTGLRSMHERAEELGGAVVISTPPGMPASGGRPGPLASQDNLLAAGSVLPR